MRRLASDWLGNQMDAASLDHALATAYNLSCLPVETIRAEQTVQEAHVLDQRLRKLFPVSNKPERVSFLEAVDALAVHETGEDGDETADASNRQPFGNKVQFQYAKLETMEEFLQHAQQDLYERMARVEQAPPQPIPRVPSPEPVSVSVTRTQPARPAPLVASQSADAASFWLLQECQALFDAMASEMFSTISQDLKSDKSDEQLQNDLFDLLGFERSV